MNMYVLVNGSLALLNLGMYAATGGLLSLGVGLFNAWVAYYCWRK